jgi:hypothetical protein
MQQGRFPGTGRPHDGHKFTFLDVQVEILKHVGFHKFIGVIFKYVP